MSDVATTKLSSRGQVVIPEEIRSKLGLEPGARFVVLGEGDTVILKTIQAPSFAEFDSLLAQARNAAERVGLREEDIDDAIRVARER